MSEKDPLTEPWKHRGMDQLCSKLHPEADKGCTDAGDRLPFAEKQFHTENRNYSHDFCVCVQTCSQGYQVGLEPFGELFPIQLLQHEKDD